MKTFELSFTATPGDIDELGHVNNARWVEWIQAIAVAHWNDAAALEHREAYLWVVVRHEIDYLRPALPGETVIGRTWVAEGPKGARFDRHVQFSGPDEKLKLRARTTWAMLDRESGRPLRVRPEIAAPLLAGKSQG